MGEGEGGREREGEGEGGRGREREGERERERERWGGRMECKNLLLTIAFSMPVFILWCGGGIQAGYLWPAPADSSWPPTELSLTTFYFYERPV